MEDQENNKSPETEANKKTISKEASAILLLSQHQDEFFATVLTALSSIEATSIVNQNLLMTILSAKGFSDEEIDQLKKQNSETYKSYKETFSKIYAEKIKEFKKHFTKLYSE